MARRRRQRISGGLHGALNSETEDEAGPEASSIDDSSRLSREQQSILRELFNQRRFEDALGVIERKREHVDDAFVAALGRIAEDAHQSGDLETCVSIATAGYVASRGAVDRSFMAGFLLLMGSGLLELGETQLGSRTLQRAFQDAGRLLKEGDPAAIDMLVDAAVRLAEQETDPDGLARARERLASVLQQTMLRGASYAERPWALTGTANTRLNWRSG